MKNPSSPTGGRWLWLGVILLSISVFFWQIIILGVAINPEIDLTSVILGGVLFTFIPIGLGIYCVKRARKSRRTLEPPPVPPIDITVPEEIPPVALPEVTPSVTKVETKTSGLRGKLLFWSGVILLSISAFFWLILIIGTAVDPEANLITVTTGGVLITFIPITLGVYCLKRGTRPLGLTLPESRRRKYAEFAGAALIVMGASIAIIILPAIFVSLIVFALIGGSGVLLSYWLRSVRRVLSWGLGVTACVYALVTVPWSGIFNWALLIDSLRVVVPIAVLGTLAFAWLGRKRLRPPEWFYSPDPAFVTAFKKLAPFTLLIVTPFIIGGLHDYNRRGDTSLPQVITLKVVDKWIDYSDDDESYRLKGEALDGSGSYSFGVSESFYDEHDVGSLCWIKVRSGALGYQWKESYGD